MINKNKKGLSDVVSTVLIILLVLAAVGIIGAIVLRNIGNSGQQIDSATFCATNQIVVSSCSASPNPTVVIQRVGGNTNPTSIGVTTTGGTTSATATLSGSIVTGIGATSSTSTTGGTVGSNQNRAVVNATYNTAGAPITCTSSPVVCA